MFYPLQFVSHHCELTVTNISLNGSKQFVSLSEQLVIKVKAALPRVELNSTLKEKIKAAVVKRYNADLKALDLSRFHTDAGERKGKYSRHRMVIHTICAMTEVVAHLRIHNPVTAK
jgi:hypothetical protein